MVGTLAMTAMAAWLAQATLYWPFMALMPAMTVLASSDRVSTSGQRKSFQVST